jgi:CDGSH-type Zn-finger protein
MTEPRIAQRGPYEVEAEGGRKYAWCACGRSATQPLCDGSHKDTGLRPLVTVAPRAETLYFCGCKHTKTPPFCDGSHEAL